MGDGAGDDTGSEFEDSLTAEAVQGQQRPDGGTVRGDHDRGVIDLGGAERLLVHTNRTPLDAGTPARPLAMGPHRAPSRQSAPSAAAPFGPGSHAKMIFVTVVGS